MKNTTFRAKVNYSIVMGELIYASDVIAGMSIKDFGIKQARRLYEPYQTKGWRVTELNEYSVEEVEIEDFDGSVISALRMICDLEVEIPVSAT